MRTAGRIVTRMHERIEAIAEPGRRKNDIAAEILRVGIEGLPDAGGDYPAIMPLLPSGADASAAHLTWNDEPLRAGEGTFFEIAGCYRRYHCPLCRTVFLGEPPGPGPAGGRDPARSDGRGTRPRPRRQHLQTTSRAPSSAPSRSAASTRTAAPAIP